MRYNLLGNTGLRVSELCLGTMTFGEAWGWGASRDESRRIFERFMEAGGNFLDTANHYTGGTSEEYVGEFIRADRERVVLATKFTLGKAAGDPNGAGNHRKNLVQSLEASLRRLGTDYVDLYWVHAWDGMTPLEELMRALDDQVRAGKILYVGFSDAPAWVVARANTLAEARGWTPFSAIQVQYSLMERAVERELLPMARALDLAVAAWSPLGGGVLSGKYGGGSHGGPARFRDDNPMAQAFVNARTLAIAAEVRAVAEDLEVTPSQVALAWLRTRPGVVLPILGCRTEAQLRDNLGCLDRVLPEAAITRLDAASALELGFPHDFLALPFVREIVHGGLADAITDHRAQGRSLCATAGGREAVRFPAILMD